MNIAVGSLQQKFMFIYFHRFLLQDKWNAQLYLHKIVNLLFSASRNQSHTVLQ